MLTKKHKEVNRETKMVHECEALKNNEELSVEYNNGWLYIDESVRIAGHEDCCFATGIKFCPYCGDKLMVKLVGIYQFESE